MWSLVVLECEPSCRTICQFYQLTPVAIAVAVALLPSPRVSLIWKKTSKHRVILGSLREPGVLDPQEAGRLPDRLRSVVRERRAMLLWRMGLRRR